MICTTLEQSKKLVELGIDPSTADMSYRPYREEGGISDYKFDLCPYKYASWIGYPAWSLSALLDLMPIINDDTYTMRGTLDKGAVISHEGVTCVMCQEKTPIDAAFEMIVWLKENKKI